MCAIKIQIQKNKHITYDYVIHDQRHTCTGQQHARLCTNTKYRIIVVYVHTCTCVRVVGKLLVLRPMHARYDDGMAELDLTDGIVLVQESIYKY